MSLNLEQEYHAVLFVSTEEGLWTSTGRPTIFLKFRSFSGPFMTKVVFNALPRPVRTLLKCTKGTRNVCKDAYNDNRMVVRCQEQILYYNPGFGYTQVLHLARINEARDPSVFPYPASHRTHIPKHQLRHMYVNSHTAALTGWSHNFNIFLTGSVQSLFQYTM